MALSLENLKIPSKENCYTHAVSLGVSKNCYTKLFAFPINLSFGGDLYI